MSAKVISLAGHKRKQALDALHEIERSLARPSEMIMNLQDAADLGHDVSSPCHCDGLPAHFHWRDKPWPSGDGA